MACSCSAVLAAQPLCQVLLRPAFHYTTDGLTVMLADSSTTFGQVATASVSFGDGTAASSAMQHTFDEPGTYTVCLTLSTATLNCTATYCRQITVPMTDCGTVNAYFESQQGLTNTLTLSDLSVGASNGERFWEFGDGTTSNEVSPSHTWALPGAHFVSLTRTEGQCSATYGTWIEVDGNATTCLPNLFLDFSTSTDGTNSVFDPQIVSNGNIPMLGLWSFGDGHVDTAVVGVNHYAVEGNYQTCLLVGALTPPDMDTCFSLVCHTTYLFPQVGIAEQEAATIKAWPNPFRDILQVAAGSDQRPTQVEVLDALGRVVHQQRITQPEAFSIGLGQLPVGAYTLTLRGPGGTQRITLVKVAE